MPTIRAIPSDITTHMSIVLAQLALGFWNEFCPVYGERVLAATSPRRLTSPPSRPFACKQWLPLADALGTLPLMQRVDGVVFRSNFDVLYDVPFNLTAAKALIRQYPGSPVHTSTRRLYKYAADGVERQCLELRHSIAVIEGLDMGLTAHRHIFMRLDPLASLVADYSVRHEAEARRNAKPSSSGAVQQRLRQVWLLLKTAPLKGNRVPRGEFEQILDETVARVRDAARSGTHLRVTYMTPTGKPTAQYVLGLADLTVQSLHFQRVSRDDLSDALRPSW